MVIGRIRNHVETHNWFAVTVDLAIVIVGVFLGAQANSWNERRIEHDQSVSYRGRLVAELDFNARQFAQQISYYDQVRAHALAIVATAQSGEQGNKFLVDAYQSTQLDITPPKRFIYDEMVASGLVARLGSEDLQGRVSDYYLITTAYGALFNDIPPYRELMRSLIPQGAQAQIRAHCGDIDVIDKGRLIGSRLPNDCNVLLDPATIAEAVNNIRRQPQLKTELNRYISWLNERVEGLSFNLKQTNKLRQELLEQS